MARTPLLRSLVRIARDHQEADRRGIPVDQVHEERSAGKETDGSSGVRISRRDLLVGGAATVAAAMLPASLVRARGGSGTVRVAIIGGGLAGLSAALVLADNGIPSTIYEAMDTICGRTRSTRPGKPGCGNCHAVSSRPYGDLWADGQITDIFGELIDTGHTQMQALAQRFHLPLIDLLESEPAGSTETYRFLGDYYTKAEADADFGWLYQKRRPPTKARSTFSTCWDTGRTTNSAPTERPTNATASLRESRRCPKRWRRFQGWMEGAAREGARAGVELARELRRSVSSGVGVSRREAIGYWGRKTRRTAV